MLERENLIFTFIYRFVNERNGIKKYFEKEIAGIILHTETLLKNKTLVNQMINKGFCTRGGNNHYLIPFNHMLSNYFK